MAGVAIDWRRDRSDDLFRLGTGEKEILLSRRHDRPGDKQCIERLERKENREFIWSLLQGDVIETAAVARAVTESSSRDAEAQLVHHIAQGLDVPLDLAQRQVRSLVQSKILQLCRQGDGFRWQWDDSAQTMPEGELPEYR